MILVFLITCFALLPNSSAFSKHTYQVIIPDSDNFPVAKLHGTIDVPLIEYTLCHWSRLTAVQNNGSVFSYTVPDENDVIVTIFTDNGEFRFYQKKHLIFLDTGLNTLYWHHSCVTSNTLRGNWRVYFNGVSAVTGIERSGPRKPNGTVVLGKDIEYSLDTFESRFNFTGQIADVFMWDRVLSPNEIHEVYNCRNTEDANVINWHLNSWELHNGARISSVKLPCGKSESSKK